MGTLAIKNVKIIIMEAMTFIARYPEYLATIRKVTKDEFLPILEEMEKIDPHDLVKPDTWFPDETAALGYVYWLFLKEARKEMI